MNTRGGSTMPERRKKLYKNVYTDYKAPEDVDLDNMEEEDTEGRTANEKYIHAMNGFAKQTCQHEWRNEIFETFYNTNFGNFNYNSAPDHTLDSQVPTVMTINTDFITTYRNGDDAREHLKSLHAKIHQNQTGSGAEVDYKQGFFDQPAGSVHWQQLITDDGDNDDDGDDDDDDDDDDDGDDDDDDDVSNNNNNGNDDDSKQLASGGAKTVHLLWYTMVLEQRKDYMLTDVNHNLIQSDNIRPVAYPQFFKLGGAQSQNNDIYAVRDNKDSAANIGELLKNLKSMKSASVPRQKNKAQLNQLDKDLRANALASVQANPAAANYAAACQRRDAVQNHNYLTNQPMRAGKQVAENYTQMK
jgi:hypothetical protein